MNLARYTCALWFAFASTSAIGNEDLWTTGIVALSGGDHANAETRLSHWIDERANEGIHSPEAHYNLAVALWHQKKTGRAMFHWANSALLQPGPFAAWQSLEMLSNAEHELGVRDSVSESWSFRLWVLITKNWLVAMSVLGFWLLCGCAALAIVQGERARHAAILLSITPLLLILVSGVGFSFRAATPDFGVLDGDAPVAVFRTPRDKPEEKLLELPSGALVEVSASERNFVRISEPVSGWISSASLQTLRAF